MSDLDPAATVGALPRPVGRDRPAAREGSRAPAAGTTSAERDEKNRSEGATEPVIRATFSPREALTRLQQPIGEGLSSDPLPGEPSPRIGRAEDKAGQAKATPAVPTVNPFSQAREEAVRQAARGTTRRFTTRRLAVLGGLLAAVALAAHEADLVPTSVPKPSALLSSASPRVDAFAQTRDILIAPTFALVHAEQGGAHRDYVIGVLMAQQALLERVYQEIEDPEIRLATVAAAMDHYLRTREVPQIEHWGMRLMALPETDFRVAKLRRAYHTRVAELVSGDDPAHAAWHRQNATLMEPHAGSGRREVRGGGWTPAVVAALGGAINRVAEGPNVDGSQYGAGVRAGLSSASQVQTAAARSLGGRDSGVFRTR